ncbi:MAG: divalent-cation tolerance protein CutA [Betaproteobacteria bacterium]|nr:divalent-cation tolerance protein CutA [Betaproteobacteria bacterium]
MAEPHEILFVLVNVPDRENAENLAAALVENRLAACVNMLSPCQSVYRWKGEVEHAEEIPMFIKTDQTRYQALEAFIRANHPYELPEIIALPLARGLQPYLDWVEAMCGGKEDSGEDAPCF